MKKIAIIIAAAAIAVSASAQTVVDRIMHKADVYWTSEGAPLKYKSPADISSQHVGYFDRDSLITEVEVDGDTLVIKLPRSTRTNATSRWMVGLQGGYLQLAENSSFTAGADLAYAGKYVLAGAVAGVAVSGYNQESSRANEEFTTPYFKARLGFIPWHFPLWGYDRMGWLALGYEFGYYLDKNENKYAETTVTNGNTVTTTSDYFAVEGNSMSHSVFVEARLSVKHLKGWSFGFKGWYGKFNRYYQEGSRKKNLWGVSVGAYYQIGKTRYDKDAITLENQLKSGDCRIVNEIINQMRAKK